MYIKEYLNRADFNVLRGFITCGCETELENLEGYEQRLINAKKNAQSFFAERFPTMREYDEISGYFNEQVGVFEDVFFEVGFLVGAKMIFEIYTKMKKMEESEL